MNQPAKWAFSAIASITNGSAFMAAALLLFGLSSTARAQSLDEILRQSSTRELAEQAKNEGDAVRGAVVFFQHHLACSKCHSVGSGAPSSLGPDLATLDKTVRDESIVESVLSPSQVIRKGYESVTISMVDGTTRVGLLVDKNRDLVIIRDIGRGGEHVVLPITTVDEVQINKLSIMPAGQVNSLTNRQQFLDLICYLIEIRDGGAERARMLHPSPTLLTVTLPEYERHLDHAGLIEGWNGKSFQRGEALYRRVCQNCHGTKEQPGSLPTSLRFAEGKFKNGSDPLAMYQTLTRGFGLMAAQTWMVPSQKYDVIHYIRETFVRPHNANQFVEVDKAYLAKLPKGDTLGPEPSKIEPWSAMDYGPTLTHTYEIPGASLNLAYKGIAMRLDPGPGGVSRGQHWMIFDTDTLRIPAVWSADPAKTGENFIDWRGIQLNGEHQVHPHIVGQISYTNSTGPGWANPETGGFQDDRRVTGRDGRQYGPLPRTWARFRGVYHYEQRTILSYTVGTAEVLESPQLNTNDDRIGIAESTSVNGATTIPDLTKKSETQFVLRTFNIGPRDRDLLLQVAEDSHANSVAKSVEGSKGSIVTFPAVEVPNDAKAPQSPFESSRQTGVNPSNFGFSPGNTPAVWSATRGRLRLKILAGQEPLKFSIWSALRPSINKTEDPGKNVVPLVEPVFSATTHDLMPYTKGGPPRWKQKLETRAVIGSDTGPFAVDFLTAPESNPWLAQLRFTGLDFFADGRIALCTWDGDVWIAEFTEVTGPAPVLRWQRITSGLFQPLGLKIVKDQIHLICRDQLVVLHDLNGDGETDYYECLNNDHQVTEHFHEFAMGLQTDADGNFYYAKSGRHALRAVVPHHGTLLRVSKDGSKTEILATGFRAANGVCLNPDGSFVVTDQEGFWNPKNRINWVTLDPSGKPKFYGNMFGYHDVTDSSDAAMEPPLCWITNDFDRSPAELLWVEGNQWGPLKGSLLNLSYGYGKVFVVLHERVHGMMQGGMIELPIPPFPTGVMRGRFHPTDGQLYLCGMFAWAGSATQPGGVYRLRATGQPMSLPIGLNAMTSGMKITFTDSLDPSTIDVSNIEIKTWSLKRTANYGSNHFDEVSKKITRATLSPDGKTLTIQIEDLRPTWCMEIKYAFRSTNGKPIAGKIHNTIHQLSDDHAK